MEKDLNYYKNKLIQEKDKVEKELSEIAVMNPNSPGGWDSIPPETDILDSKDEVAERMSDLDERKSLEITLEKRLSNINKALNKIENNQYGLCEVSGEPIEEDRLEINPAARTCKNHLDEEDNLF